VAAVTSVALAAGALAYGVYSGERAESAARQARYRTREAQAEALRVQMLERARSVQADLATASRPSPASTIGLDEMLASTDRSGVIDDRVKLSRPAKLGGGG
jgi:Flp pilus assembly protein TadB